jgi:MOSC domain-containing protein YiiM
MNPARLESVNVSRGGVPKTSVFEALITEHGLDGDSQADLRYHGGPKRAVMLFSLDVIRALQHEGHPIAAGTAGENLTVSGLDWAALCPGMRLQVGPVELQLTSFAAPCGKIRRSFLNEDYMRVAQESHPGFSRIYARVLAGGLVRPGDPITGRVDAAGSQGHVPRTLHVVETTVLNNVENARRALRRQRVSRVMSNNHTRGEKF